MPFQLIITEEAERQLRSLSARDQRILEAAIQARLVHQPTQPTRAIKRLRPNSFAEFELRVGELRVLYNVEGDAVIILIFGRKAGNKLIVAGEEFHVHKDHSVEPPEGGAGKDSA